MFFTGFLYNWLVGSLTPSMDVSATENVGGQDPLTLEDIKPLTPNDDVGKKRKHCNISTNAFGGEASLFKAYGSVSSDEKVSLVILKQPEKQHRARYHTEGMNTKKNYVKSKLVTLKLLPF